MGQPRRRRAGRCAGTSSCAPWRACTRTQGEEQLLDWLLRPGEARVLAFVNAHAMNTVAESEPFYQALMSADVVVRDGIGVSLLMQLLNQVPGQNLNGTDLIPQAAGARRRPAHRAVRHPRALAAQAAQEVVQAKLAPRQPVHRGQRLPGAAATTSGWPRSTARA